MNGYEISLMSQKIKEKRRMLDRIQEDSFDPYKEIANNRGHYKKTEDLYYLVLNLHMSKKQKYLRRNLNFCVMNVVSLKNI